MSQNPTLATLNIIAGPEAGKAIELPEKELFIGRIAPADIVISHAEVSRRHARLFFRDGNYSIEDLGSKNGVRVNGQKIAAGKKAGDLLRPRE